LSCGTGVTACALVELQRLGVEEGEVHVHTKGGDINVIARREGDGFADIYLSGPAEFVFEGKITV
jgi:diaminopimelate epimerase